MRRLVVFAGAATSLLGLVVALIAAWAAFHLRFDLDRDPSDPSWVGYGVVAMTAAVCFGMGVLVTRLGRRL